MEGFWGRNPHDESRGYYRASRWDYGVTTKSAFPSLGEFMDFSAQRQVSLHYTQTDLCEDRVTADRLKFLDELLAQNIRIDRQILNQGLASMKLPIL